MQMFNLEATFKKVANQLKRVGGGAKFFNAQGKRGESVELHQDLNSNDRERQKNALKRIIANMTLGRDVSQLFADVVKLGQTPNLEVKKLVYLYVLSNAKLQPDKALMAVNTFLQDANHASPIVRALALRTMLCLRVDSVVEYTIPPLIAALSTVGEADAYVRKTAAIGVGKIFHQSPVLFEQHGLMRHLTSLLGDTFPVVSSNAAAVLAEILSVPGHPVVEMQKAWVGKLLNALSDATEWGQVYILEALSLYNAGMEEVENLTERVLPRLSHANSAVVLAAVKAMATFITKMPVGARGQYIARINAAFLTLARSDSETQFVVCRNAQMLLSVFPEVLSDNFDSFFIRFTDPPYVKIEKLRLLLRLVTPASAPVVIKELAEYANEIDAVFVAEVINAAAYVGIKVESVAERAAELVRSVGQSRPDMLARVIIAAKDMLRKYPNLVLDLLPALVDQGADAVVEEDAKVAFVWMMGEFCDVIENGVDTLTTMAEAFDDQDLPTKRALLSAVLKLFLRNPAGTEKLLTSVIDSATRSSNPDLRDRGLFYFRLLSRSIGSEKLRAIVQGRRTAADADKVHNDGMTPGEILRSLNSVAAVYAKPPRKFVPSYGCQMGSTYDDEDDENPDSPKEPAPAETFAPVPTAPVVTPPQAAPVATAPPAKPPAAKHVDVMDSLFAPAAPAKPTAAPIDPFDAVFNPVAATPPPTASPSSVNLPREVVSAAANAGVSIHAEFAPGAGNSSVDFRVGLRNGSAVPITTAQLQINRNRFSIAPLTQLQLNGPIAPGGSAEFRVPTGYTDGHYAAGPSALQAGVAVNGRVVTFTIDMPAALMLDFCATMDRNDFARTWQSLDAASERTMTLPSARGQKSATVLPALTTNRVVSVAQVSNAAGVERLFCACKLHSGVAVLLEIQLPAADVTIRCARIAEAFETVQTVLTAAVGGSRVPDVNDLFA